MFAILKGLNLLLPLRALNRPGRSACLPPRLLAAGPRDYLGRKRNRLRRWGTWEPAPCAPAPACTNGHAHKHTHSHTCTHTPVHKLISLSFASLSSHSFFHPPTPLPLPLVISHLKLFLSGSLDLGSPPPHPLFLLVAPSLPPSVLVSIPPLSACLHSPPLASPVFARMLAQPLLYLFFLGTQMTLRYNCLQYLV